MTRDVASAVIDPDETWLHPSPRLGIMRRVQIVAVCSVAAIILLAVTGAAALSGSRGAVTVGALVLAGIAAAGFLGDRFAQRRVRAWAYREREDDLMVHRGVMIKRLSVIPYGRMQFIDVIAGPVERAFGLATVRMHTAAAASDARIPGLPQDEAARLRDHLAQLGEAKAAGL
jgi:membrane protein YdbS with pleckstrin-like domain